MSCLLEAGRLRRLAANPKVVFLYSGHAGTEMRKDSIVKFDLENMIRRCGVTQVEIDKFGEETWRAEGKDGDGRHICAVVVAYEESCEIKVITAWAK